MKMALRFRTKLTDTMMNQMSHRILPSEIRRRVMAKLVLLHAVPRMDQNPVWFMMSSSFEKVGPVVVMFQLCFPKPLVVDIEPNILDITKVICLQFCR